MYNKNLLKTMKATREFEFAEGLFTMKTVYFPEDDSLDFPYRITVGAIVDPLVSDDHVTPWSMFLDCAPDVPLDLRIDEMQFFTRLISQMYLQ